VIDTGDGVDDLNYSPSTHLLYVGAAKDARVTVARVDASGKLSQIALVPPTRALATASSRKIARCISRTRSSVSWRGLSWCRRAGSKPRYAAQHDA
jgi:hypothetical protein